ncbi:uncharacterized protein CcaverHIS019_0106070 [Cutaneotrichosporon cavernicola]|uniref:TIP41-domain-containing protein n=1 Tax=Cutaneotrichosporon cavernicola TaxID=279322 RepID=A0AA48KX48_9TREE|nr:uncharacterized protein CcaverHIS019_0106070 [Cutaneotrichosporon cavernicola]BEI87889.1 hypothetical protein CcaverHIS019_0106070 [Cutaneotrichosporon cavernicola]BEI95663.1 hypothetical protein CcaverHIS631_0106120 [Cutaneotrichosporon cavernicola]
MSNIPPAAAVPGPLLSPSYKLEQGKLGSEMRIGNWTIRSVKTAILNGKEIDAVEKELCLPLPEMTFGNNGLDLMHQGVRIKFDGISALRQVAVGEGWEERVGGGVLVSMADSWSQRSASSALSDVPLSTKPVRPHDWTFSTTYAGTVTGSTFEPSETARIPMQLLARQDPVLDRILFYEDVGLFHDELHDHGESIMNVRLRVMPHSLFLLSRLFVRVDNVLFRIFDVRMYHAFESDEVVRECTGLEGDYDEVKKYLEKPSELAPLTDPNWVYGVLQKIAAKRDDNQADQAVQTQPATQRTQAPWTQTTAAPRASSAAPRETSAPIASRPSLSNSPSSSKKPWPGLGRRVHVLRLPGTDTGLASAQAGLRDLNLEP